MLRTLTTVSEPSGISITRPTASGGRSGLAGPRLPGSGGRPVAPVGEPSAWPPPRRTICDSSIEACCESTESSARSSNCIEVSSRGGSGGGGGACHEDGADPSASGAVVCHGTENWRPGRGNGGCGRASVFWRGGEYSCGSGSTAYEPKGAAG